MSQKPWSSKTLFAQLDGLQELRVDIVPSSPYLVAYSCGALECLCLKAVLHCAE